ncbi:MAG: purine-nucleoside phosphorylase [Clostridia bacterium]|nr:purine-nucleoside phosphorylase [Clostridia bacterium]
MSTPHNSAEKGAFAKTVLMPGDPLRAKYVAENFLENPTLVNNVRGVRGYTGTWKGKAVSVMASGMGMPSMGIYSYELFAFYDVENIIRIGTTGSISEKLHVMDIFLAQAACTDSNWQSQYHLPGTFAPIADFGLIMKTVEQAKAARLNVNVGNVLSSDVFYYDDPDHAKPWQKMGIMALEMESAALYMNAARLGKKALTICTVTDHLLTGEELPAEMRQNNLNQMITLALNVAADI